MAINAEAKITLRGGSEALKQLQGVSRGTRAASKEAQQAAKETERWQKLAIASHNQRIRAEQAGSREQVKLARQVQLAKERAETDAGKVAEREARRYQRLAQQSADFRIREEAKVSAAAQREAAKQVEISRKTAASQAKARRDAFRAAGGIVGTLAAGALAGAYATSSTARGVAGAKDAQQRVVDANAFRERLVLVTSQAGIKGDDREAVQSQVLAASKATGTDIGDLMGVLETGQAQFNNLKFFADNLTEIATMSKAAGADTGEFAKALGSIQSAFGLTGDEAIQAAYLMKSASDQGAIDVKDFASSFASSAGLFALNTKQKGIGGVRQFLGTAQGIGTGQFGGAESSTRLDRFVSDLNDVDVRKKLGGIGIKNIADKSGKIDVGRVLDQLAGNRKFQDASVRQGIFEDIRGREGVETLLSARAKVKSGQAGAVDFTSIAGVSEQAGRQAVAGSFADLQSGGALQFAQEAAKMQADTVEHLGEYNAQVLRVLEASNKLETAFGSLSLWASSIAAVGLTSIGTSVAGKLLGGGGAAAEGSAATGMLGKMWGAGKGALAGAAGSAAGWLGAGATTVGAAGAGAIAGTVGAGLAVGGAIGTGANKLTSYLRDDGQDISELIVSKLIDRTRGQQLTSGGTRNDDGTLKQAVRVLERIDSGIRATNDKPKPGGPREPY